MEIGSQNLEIKEILQSYLMKSFNIASNDPLANVFQPGIIPYVGSSMEMNSIREKLFRQVKNIQKEFGINPLCISTGILKLIHKEKEYCFPIQLREANLTLNKLSRQFILEDKEEIQINPFLIHFFQREFELEIPRDLSEFNSFFNDFKLVTIDSESQFVGNFHPHRFEIIRELQSLIESEFYSKNLTQLLGIQSEINDERLLLSTNNLVLADPDQHHVIETVSEKNCVVQGPPGTGKSQVIINLLGRILEKEECALIVSEKRVALDVLQKKMNALELGGLCYTTTNHFSNSDFIFELKKEWERIELMLAENIQFNPSHTLIENDLQNMMNLLHQPNLAQGKSILEFLKEFQKRNIYEGIGYSSKLPSLSEWDGLKSSVRFIFDHNLSDLFSQFKTELIQKDFLLSIESKIHTWKNHLKKLMVDQETFTYSQLYELARKSIVLSKFESAIFKKFGEKFFSKPIQLKKLQKLRKELQDLKIKEEELNLQNAHWQQLPNKEEVSFLKELFSKKGFILSFQQKKTWKKWTRSPELDPLECLNFRLNQLSLLSKKRELYLSLNTLGIDNEQELREINILNSTISLQEYDEFKSLNSDEFKKITSNTIIINQLITDLKVYFRFDDSTNLLNYFTHLEKKLHLILEHCEQHSFGSKFLSFLTNNFKSIEEIEAQIWNSTWSKLKIDFPKLNDFNWGDFYRKTELLLEATNHDLANFSRFLLQKQKAKFDTYHSILITSPAKLSSEEKNFRQGLKEGKRILVKEFSKSKNHSSIRQLIDSPAKIWIDLLKPIWFMNPTRLATCFPLKKDMFSLLIFDEASQIPFENALGALQRSKRVVVAGDPQQMSPSSYFSSTGETVDLLHHASYYLPNCFLSYHYRSFHPDLISFSNKHFYQNRLYTFQHADFTKNPIEFHYIEGATFREGVNKKEAVAVAEYLSKRLKNSESIGIVSFSEAQLSAIYEELSPQMRELLQTRIDSDEVFFKAIENVQGDECDELIISFGYAYSHIDNTFSMRFGPMNLSTGPKRLNVLLTRARKRINFFASVKHHDFKNSSNESVNLIRKWFHKMENLQQNNVETFFQINFQELIEKNINMLAVSTLLIIYKERKWKISIE